MACMRLPCLWSTHCCNSMCTVDCGFNWAAHPTPPRACPTAQTTTAMCPYTRWAVPLIILYTGHIHSQIKQIRNLKHWIEIVLLFRFCVKSTPDNVVMYSFCTALYTVEVNVAPWKSLFTLYSHFIVYIDDI